MKIKKWNNQTMTYDSYEVPDDWKLIIYSENMDTPINCVCCGKEMTFGEGYTSRRFHTAHGIGYSECEKCYFSYKE